MQALQQLHDCFAVVRVKVTGGFVGQQMDGCRPVRDTATRCCWPPEVVKDSAGAGEPSRPFERFHHPRLALHRGHLPWVGGSSTFS
jgi:hypothetical protein